MKVIRQTLRSFAVAAAVLSAGLAALTPVPAAATVTPDFSELTLRPGESAQILKRVVLPRLPTTIDVALIVDLSGTFNDDLANIRAQLPQVFDQLAAQADTRFGLATFVDYPLEPWGFIGTGDYAYRRDLDLTADPLAFSAALNAMRVRFGNDQPESQYEALFQATTGAGRDLPSAIGDIAPGQGLQFRPEAAKFVILATDAPFHTPDDSACFNTAACPFGYPGPSRDQTVAALNEAGIQVIALAAPGAGAEMQDLADATGGSLQTTTSTSADIGNAILAGLAEVGTTITPTVDDACAVEVRFDPPNRENVAGGSEVVFTETVTAPAGIVPGRYTCTITFGSAGSQQLVVTVPQQATTLTAAPALASIASGNLLQLNLRYAATLVDDSGIPVAGETVRFGAGRQVCSGITNLEGVASCSVNLSRLLAATLGGGYDARFDGSAQYLPSSDRGSLTTLLNLPARRN